ncbi:MAG: hypothetical protein V4683_02395 [Bacteroidota bacterium]
MNLKIIRLILLNNLLLIGQFNLFGQLGLNETNSLPDISAVLDVSSSNKGILIPRMNSLSRTGIVSPALGLMVYDTDEEEIYVFNAGWRRATRSKMPIVYEENLSDAILNVKNLGFGLAASFIAKETALSTISQNSHGILVQTFSPLSAGKFINSFGGSGGSAIEAENNSVGSPTGLFKNNEGDGVQGFSKNSNGVFGQTSGIGSGVYGRAQGGGSGMAGFSDSGYGVAAISNSGLGIAARSNSNHGISSHSEMAIGGVFTSSNNRGLYSFNFSSEFPTGFFQNGANGPSIELDGGIKISGSKPAAFQVSSTGSINPNANYSFIIPNTTQANNANDILIVTHYFANENDNYLTKPFGIRWDGTNWNIFLEDLSPMPEKITFNVLVIKR